MTTTNKSLDAASVRDKILKAKGSFVKAAWKSEGKPAAAHKGVLLEKKTVAVVQAGVNYANLSAVKDAIAAGERGEVQELPWGQWYVDKLSGKSWFPHVIEHKDELYLRLYPSQGNNHKTSSVYYVNGVEVNVGTHNGCYCAFSADAGTTLRDFGREEQGDELYWNTNIGVVDAPFQLTTDDEIDFVYLTVDLLVE